MSIEERNKLIQEVIDRILYSDGYKEELIKLNEKFIPKKKIVYNVTDFKFPLEKVIY